MKRLLAVFELTVPEQRALIVLLSLLIAFVAVENRRHRGEDRAIPSKDAPAQLSPSPGIRP